MDKENIKPVLYSVLGGTIFPLSVGLLFLNNLAAKDLNLPPPFSLKEETAAAAVDLGRIASLLLGNFTFPANLFVYLFSGLVSSAYTIYKAGRFFSENLSD